MSDTKHTLGPWRYVNDSPYHRVDTYNGLLYVVSSDGANYKEEQEQANAKLIAAAPTMYDYVLSKANSGDEIARQIINSII